MINKKPVRAQKLAELRKDNVTHIITIPIIS